MSNQTTELFKVLIDETDEDLNDVAETGDITHNSFGEQFNQIFDEFGIVKDNPKEVIKYKILNPRATPVEIAQHFNMNRSYISQFFSMDRKTGRAYRKIKEIVDNEQYNAGITELKVKSVNADDNNLDLLQEMLTQTKDVEQRLAIIKAIHEIVKHFAPIVKETKQEIRTMSAKIDLPYKFNDE